MSGREPETGAGGGAQDRCSDGCPEGSLRQEPEMGVWDGSPRGEITTGRPGTEVKPYARISLGSATEHEPSKNFLS